MRLAGLAFLIVVMHAAEPPRPLEFVTTFARADLGRARLAPDGRHVAYWFHEHNELFVGVLDIDAAVVTMQQSVGPEEETALSLTFPATWNYVTDLRWVSSRRLLVQTTNGGILAVDADGQNAARLADLKEYPWRYTRTPVSPPLSDPVAALPYSFAASSYGRSVRVIGTPTAEFVTIEASNYAGLSPRDRETEVFRVNLATAKFERIFEDTIAGRLIYDQQGRPRILVSDEKGAPRFYATSAAGKIAWRPLGDQLRRNSKEFDLAGDAFFRPRSLPLGFDVNPDILYVASNIARDTMGVFAVDLKTGERTAAAIESAERDLVLPTTQQAGTAVLVFDPFTQQLAGVRLSGVKTTTAWADADLAKVQLRLDQLMPRHAMRVIDWDERRERFLIHAYHRTDPGAFLIYTKSTDRLRSYLPVMKAAPSARQTVTTPWMRRLADGRVLTGSLALPTAPRTRPIPTVLYLSGQWEPVESNFDPEVAALCLMGFAVLEVNPRGTPGHGLAHWLAGRENLDHVVAEDYLAAFDQLAADAGLDPSHVAAVGNRFGGYLALRLSQLHPERIHAVAAIDPVTHLANWVHPRESSSAALNWHYANRRAFFGGDEQRLKEQSPYAHPDRLTKPLLLVASSAYPSEGVEPHKLRSLVRSAGGAPAWLDLTNQRPAAAVRAETFAAIKEFLTKELAGKKTDGD